MGDCSGCVVQCHHKASIWLRRRVSRAGFDFGQQGRQEFSVEKLLNERPEYFVFNALYTKRYLSSDQARGHASLEQAVINMLSACGLAES
jgi:hypothetical protein